MVGEVPGAGADAQLRFRRSRQGHRGARGHRRHRVGGRRADRTVQPGGQHRLHSRRTGNPRRPALDLGGRHRLLPHRRRKAVARHGGRMPQGDRRGQHVGGSRRILRITVGRRYSRRLACARGRRRRHRRCRGAVGAAADDRSVDNSRNGARRNRSRGSQAMTEHGAAAAVELLPVEGLPEFRPGDDLAAALADAAPWLQDGDVVVVTSKVLSKCEGRIVAAPADPEERDTLRRKLIDEEAVRVLARKGRTLITENNLGLVQAAAGVDGSNIGSTELALLPVDPDGSAAALRTRLHDLLGVTVGIVVTDTMGRAWRNGQIDAAIGAAGLTVLHGYGGAHDAHGNELVVTEVAVADEIAAAADLVKGKLTGIPVAVVRGLALHDDGSNGRTLVRAGEEDLFWLGTEEAIAMGRRQAQLLRRSIRHFSTDPVDPALVEEAVAEALTAPAPHHTRPVRFVWVRDHQVRLRLLDGMKERWRADLLGDG